MVPLFRGPHKHDAQRETIVGRMLVTQVTAVGSSTIGDRPCPIADTNSHSKSARVERSPRSARNHRRVTRAGTRVRSVREGIGNPLDLDIKHEIRPRGTPGRLPADP